MKISPPAFPTWIETNSMAHGMTLRDYFAAKAMHAYIGSFSSEYDLVRRAYELADKMLQEREK
jgi:hypothetical protein